MMVAFSVSFHFLFGFFPSSLVSSYFVYRSDLAIQTVAVFMVLCFFFSSFNLANKTIWHYGVKYCIKRFLVPPFWLHVFFFLRSILIQTLLLLFHLTESFYQFITAFGSCIFCLQKGYIENLPYFRVCSRTSIESINKI